jgi:hypothetical protein
MDELAWTVVPPFDPPDVEAWVANSISQAMLQEPHRRAYLWANWLLQQAARDQLSIVTSAINGAFTGDFEKSDITAGFIPVAPQTKRDAYLQRATRNDRRTHFYDTSGLLWTFGLVVGVRPVSGEVQGAEMLIERPVPTQFLDIDGFPVICEQRWDSEIEAKATAFHAPSHPSGAATSTCYVRPASGKRYYGRQWSEGILIARHVLGNLTYPGAQVLMQSGATLQVVDIDSSATTIDAAILDAGWGVIPAGINQVGLHPAIAPGINVNIAGSQTQFPATVLRVMDDPRYFGNMMAHRAVLDNFGVRGDSGAFVTEQLTGQAVGLYIGRLPGPPAEGIVQLMRQVTTYFQAELYC